MTAFVADSDSGTSTIFVDPKEAAVSSSDPAYTRLFTGEAKPRQVRNRTLDSILAESGLQRPTTCPWTSRWESRLHSAASINRFRPRLACVRRMRRRANRSSTTSSGTAYTVVGRYLRIDPANLYFTPLQ